MTTPCPSCHARRLDVRWHLVELGAAAVVGTLQTYCTAPGCYWQGIMEQITAPIVESVEAVKVDAA